VHIARRYLREGMLENTGDILSSSTSRLVIPVDIEFRRAQLKEIKTQIPTYG